MMFSIDLRTIFLYFTSAWTPQHSHFNPCLKETLIFKAISILFVFAGFCRARSSTGNCCIFPFIYRGRRYNRCTRVRSKRPWCALTPNYDKDKLFGYCGGRKRECIDLDNVKALCLFEDNG